MKLMAETAATRPPLSRAEAKGDATTRAAREIIESEAAARAAKTERLRAERLAREAEAPAPVAKKAGRKR